MSCYTWGTDKTLKAVFYEITDRGILPDVTNAVGKRIIARYGNVLINRITQVNGIKNLYWDDTLVLSCPWNDDTTKLTDVLEIFVGTTAWQQFATVSTPQNGWITITSVLGDTADATTTYNNVGVGDLVNVYIDSGVSFIPSWWGTVSGLSSLGITHLQNVQGISGECRILARVCKNVDDSIYLDFLRDSGVATKNDLEPVVYSSNATGFVFSSVITAFNENYPLTIKFEFMGDDKQSYASGTAYRENASSSPIIAFVGTSGLNAVSNQQGTVSIYGNGTAVVGTYVIRKVIPPNATPLP